MKAASSAAQAWNTLRPDSPAPARVETLHAQRKGRGKSSVFRLHGVAAPGGSVIAKRGRNGSAEFEQFVYEHFVSRLSVTSLQVYGVATERPGRLPWAFLEDAGDEPLLLQEAAHRSAAFTWIAQLHAGASRLERLRQLPARDAAYYFTCLAEARAKLAGVYSLTTDDGRSLLTELQALLARVERFWPEFERACAGFPVTLVHGDFIPKNIRVRRGASEEITLRVFDWEMVGCGSPAVDLGALAFHAGAGGEHQYHSVVREAWPELTVSDVTEMLRIGMYFRTVAAIRSQCEWLALDQGKPVTVMFAPFVNRLRRLFVVTSPEYLAARMHPQSSQPAV